MMAKNYIFFKLIIMVCTVSYCWGDPSDETDYCCPEEPAPVQGTTACYTGSLDLNLKDSLARDFTILYDGLTIKVRDGVYCFKDQNSLTPIFMLFVKPSRIVCSNDEHTVNNLMLQANTHYDCFALIRVEHPSTGLDPLFDWGVIHVLLPSVTIKKKSYLKIPAHTIIFPLSGRFFAKSTDGAIIFEGQPQKDNGNIIRLPTPRIAANNQQKVLLNALIKSDLALLNLKNMHAAQEQCLVCMDKHTLVQE